ncbi:MAG: amino acid permease, partial [Proteobacteria bacterium]|nr:amino acid permease [Pseudomonadota bacterium]
MIAISIGAMLGSGIFVLPGMAASITGPSVWLAYLVAGLCVLPAALSKAELGTAMPTSGGTYVYLDRALGPLAGTVSGVGLWLSLLLKSAFALVGISAYLYVLWDLPLTPTALTLLAVVTALNLLGVRKVGKAQTFIVIVSLLGLGAMVIWGFSHMQLENIEQPFKKGGMGFVGAMAFVYVSFAGVTKIAAVAEEVKDPARNIPRGILISLVLVTLVYGAVVFTMVSVLSVEKLQGDLSPVYSLGLALGGPTVGVIAALLGVFTLTSMANAGLLASSRFPFAMSRDRLLPPALKKIHPQYMTPFTCILLTALVMAAVIALVDIERIVKMASAFIIMAYVAENAVVIVFRQTGSEWYNPDYRAPLYPFIQIAGILIGVLLLIKLGLVTLIAFVAMGLPGLAIYLAYGRSRIVRPSVLSQNRNKQTTEGAEMAEFTPRSDDGATIVTLFGAERSPEILVELGAALSEKAELEVLHVTEVPEQTILDVMLEEDLALRSLRRRISAMASDRNLDIQVNPIVSRNTGKTVVGVAAHNATDWLVMSWRGHRSFLNPVKKWVHLLPCNLALFKDNGVRYFRKILVFTDPGPHDALIARTSDRLAIANGAKLTFMRHIPKSASPARVEAELSYLSQIVDMCESPTDIELVEGDTALAAIGARTSGFDLLIMEANWEASFFGLRFGTANDRLTMSAACSVLQLRTPQEQTHQAYHQVANNVSEFPLSDHIVPGCVQPLLEPVNKEALFSHIATSFASTLHDLLADEIENALWANEQAQNTAVGSGVAFPNAILHRAHHSYLGVFTTARSVP